MAKTPIKQIPGFYKIPGGSGVYGVPTFNSSIANIPQIDLTAATLDSRVTYTGPAHYYWAQNGLMALSQANVWPVEYRNGVAVGRHEPEPAITNWQVLNRANVESANVVKSSDFTLINDATGAPDGGAIGRLPKTADSYWLSQDVGSVSLINITPYNFVAGWSRIVNAVASTQSSKIRSWLGRNGANGTPNLFQTQGANLAVRSWVFSWFVRPNEDGTTFAAGLTQIERENYPFATSPVINESTSFGTRAASSVTVAKVGLANNLRVYFTDGTTAVYSFGSNNSITLNMAGANWGTRFITKMVYEA